MVSTAATSATPAASVASAAATPSSTPAISHRTLLVVSPSSTPQSSSSTQPPPPGARCYIASLYNAEVDLASAVSSRAVLASTVCNSVNGPSLSRGDGQLNQPTPADCDSLLADPNLSDTAKGGSKGGSAVLTDMQRWAVELASSAPIMLLTGEELCVE